MKPQETLSLEDAQRFVAEHLQAAMNKGRISKMEMALRTLLIEIYQDKLALKDAKQCQKFRDALKDHLLQTGAITLREWVRIESMCTTTVDAAPTVIRSRSRGKKTSPPSTP